LAKDFTTLFLYREILRQRDIETERMGGKEGGREGGREGERSSATVTQRSKD
jgi:hypothetical protein